MNTFSNFGNIDFLLVIFTSLIILFLGFVTFLNNQKSITNKTFLIFTVLATFYAVSNYLFYTFSNKDLIILASRFVAFFVTWYSFFLFQFFYTFPKITVKFSKKYKYILVPAILLTSCLCLTPFVFSDIQIPDEPGQIPIPKVAWGAGVFAIMSMFLTFSSFYLLIKKIKNAKPEEFHQYLLVLIGTVTTYSLYILFSLIFTVVFGNTSFIPLAPIFIIPFVVLTFYSIVRYRFLNIKIIATEAITLTLVIISLFEVFLSEGIQETLYKMVVFTLVTVLGGFLIKSVRREVEQREKLSKLTAELEQKTQILEDLSSINNHQQRTPLTVIKGGIDILEHSKLTKKQQQEIFDQMKNRVERMLHTLTEFSVGFSPNPKPVNPIPEKGNLEEAVRMIYDEHFELEQSRQRRDTTYKKLQFSYKPPKSPLPPVWFDKNNTLHIISNLLDNAVSYSDSGTIEVSYGTDAKNAIVYIKDNGMGVTEEEKKIIFEKAKRSDRAKKRYAFGSGLGLFLARQIAVESGGSLDVQSAGEGKGSTFVLKLPLYTGQDAQKKNDAKVNK